MIMVSTAALINALSLKSSLARAGGNTTAAAWAGLTFWVTRSGRIVFARMVAPAFLNTGNRLIMLQPVGNRSECKCPHSARGLLLGSTVHRYSGKRGNIGKPAAVLFAFVFDSEIHGHLDVSAILRQ